MFIDTKGKRKLQFQRLFSGCTVEWWWLKCSVSNNFGHYAVKREHRGSFCFFSREIYEHINLAFTREIWSFHPRRYLQGYLYIFQYLLWVDSLSYMYDAWSERFPSNLRLQRIFVKLFHIESNAIFLISATKKKFDPKFVDHSWVAFLSILTQIQ